MVQVAVDRLRELFHYDPATGVFTRRVATTNTVRVGDVATCRNAAGYVVLRADGRLYRANRLAWLYMTGEWPSGTIDHRDGDRANDRWSNLRDVPFKTNCENARKARVNNKSGLLGVSPDRGRKRWVASIVSEGRKTHLGTFDTPAAAHHAYLDAKRGLHAGCTL